MKKILLATTIVLLLVNCETGTSQEINPEMAKLEGKWQLVKIVAGFRAANSPAESIPTYQETLAFDFAKKTFSRTKEGKTTPIKIANLTNGGTVAREAIIFEKEDTYSFYSFTENPTYLVLYQPTPIGAILADGSSFFYEKVK